MMQDVRFLRLSYCFQDEQIYGMSIDNLVRRLGFGVGTGEETLDDSGSFTLKLLQALPTRVCRINICKNVKLHENIHDNYGNKMHSLGHI